MRNANHLVKRFVEVLEDGERWERQVACTKAEAIDYIKHAMEYGFDEDCFDHVLMADGRSFHAQEEKLPANWQRDMVAWEQCNSVNTLFWVSGKADEGDIAWASYDAENDWELMTEYNDNIEAFLMVGDELVDHHVPESEGIEAC